jgi:hypothetical protein
MSDSETGEIVIRLPTTTEEADRIMQFVFRQSDVIFQAIQSKGGRCRFYFLVAEASVDHDRLLYGHSLMPLHRRLACADPEASMLRSIPSAQRTSFTNLDTEGLAALIKRRQLGVRKGQICTEGENTVISIANLSHLHGKPLQNWIEHAFQVGVKYVVVMGDFATMPTMKPKEAHNNVALFSR